MNWSVRVLLRQEPSSESHFYYEPHLREGTVRQSFDIWFDRDAQFFTEWRDAADYPRNVGPGVSFHGNGQVGAAG